jgi:Tfp pilus assembly protein PilX
MTSYDITLQAQRGVVLVLVLLFLFVLTLLSLSLFETAVLQTKMTGNASNRDIAFWHAESALSAAQRMLVIKPTPSVVTGNGWKYVAASSEICWDKDALGCYCVTATGQAGPANVVLKVIYQLMATKKGDEWVNIKISRRSWVESDGES